MALYSNAAVATYFVNLRKLNELFNKYVNN